MNTYVKEYTSFMTDIRHKSLNTVESYKRDVTQYISYLDGTGQRYMGHVGGEAVLRMGIDVWGAGKARRSVPVPSPVV